jgi:hypothetical protein
MSLLTEEKEDRNVGLAYSLVKLGDLEWAPCAPIGIPAVEEIEGRPLRLEKLPRLSFEAKVLILAFLACGLFGVPTTLNDVRYGPADTEPAGKAAGWIFGLDDTLLLCCPGIGE